MVFPVVLAKSHVDAKREANRDAHDHDVDVHEDGWGKVIA